MTLSENDLRAASKIVAEVIRNHRLGLMPIPVWMRGLNDRLDREVVSRARQEIGCPVPSLEVDKWIGSTEAATILGWSKRQVQRRASDLDGEKVSGRWLFRESTVRDYAEGMQQDARSA